MQISILVAYIVSVTLLIATPGPVVALVINASVKQGPKYAFLTALGTNWASILLISMAVLVISGVMTVSQEMMSWLSVFGCLFIAYIAIESLIDFTRKKRGGKEGEKLECKVGSIVGVKSFSKGFFVAISNPKDVIFFIAFFPQFFNVTDSFFDSVLVLVFIWVVIDLSILCFYIFLMQNKVAKNYQVFIEVTSSVALLLISIVGLLYIINS